MKNIIACLFLCFFVINLEAFEKIVSYYSLEMAPNGRIYCRLETNPNKEETISYYEEYSLVSLIYYYGNGLFLISDTGEKDDPTCRQILYDMKNKFDNKRLL